MEKTQLPVFQIDGLNGVSPGNRRGLLQAYRQGSPYALRQRE